MHTRHLQLRTSLFMLLALSLAIACKDSEASEKKAQPEQKIVLRTVDEAKAFISNNLKQPIPEDYKIPSYITSKLPLEQVYDTLKLRYPTFYGKEGESYIQAIMADPNTYLKLSLESKSIRRYYDPNSDY